MTHDEVRRLLVEAVNSTSIFVFKAKGFEAVFLSGESDVPMSELDVDSLGITELCIAIETSTGVELESSEVAGSSSLAEVAAKISARIG
jgi:hypothetical protein